MQYLFTYIEQLDLAAQQLQHLEDPAYGRFSQILTDNIIELIFHQRCQQEMWMEDLWLKAGMPRYSAKVREGVLGKYFAPKAKFVMKLGMIKQSELEFTMTCHEYRNELYHTGIQHDDFIYALAWEHHTFACNILKRQKAHSWHSGLRVSDAVRRHGLDEKVPFTEDFKSRLEAAAQSLINSKPARAESFSATLSKSLLSNLKSAQSSLDFLVKDNPNGLDEAQLLDYLQHHQHRYGPNEPKYDALLFIQEGEPSIIEKLKKVRSSWVPKYRNNPIPRWIKRAELLSQERDPINALKKHESLHNEARPFIELAHNAAAYLDNYLMYLSDVARGK
jgi:hypothetical protein